MTLSSLKDMTSEDIETKADTGQRAWIENVGPIDKPDTVVEIYRSYLPEYRVETEKGLVRKIYMRLLPLLVVIYLFNYLDRNSITQARLYGLQKDTHVDGAVYQTAMSIFSAGYIAIQLPSAMLMTKPWPSRFLVSAHTLQSNLIIEHRTDLLQPSCIIGWAIVSGLNSATNSPASLLTVRFFLDMIDSCWYTKRELGIRMALLICGILLSNSFAGLISAGILSGMQGVGRLAA